MIAITMMIIAMLFTYRIIKVGPFMTPGAVFIFAMTYTVADIITEIYGFNLAKQVIWSTFFCIIFFNLTCFFLIRLPVPSGSNYEQAYNLIFSHGISLMLGFAISFVLSDLINAFAINHWRALLKGKYFWLRSIGSSAVGETLFGIIAAALMYSHYMSFGVFVRVIASTWCFKIITSILMAYPATVVVELLKKAENINPNAYFHELSFPGDQ
jgi:uncharacterized integral membrane protein (TIGR00697 family)